MTGKPVIRVVAALIVDDQGKFLITRRLFNAHLGGLWEFPGGKIEDGEAAAEALRRELQEELSIDVKVGPCFWQETFEYDIKIINISFHWCRIDPPGQTIKPGGVETFRWTAAAEMDRFPFPPADQALIRRLEKLPRPPVVPV